MAMERSTPEMGGPLTSTQRQGWPRTLRAVQQASFGGMGLNGATDARHGISCTNAEKNVLPQGNPALPCTITPSTTTTTTTATCFFSIFFYLYFYYFIITPIPFIAILSFYSCRIHVIPKPHHCWHAYYALYSYGNGC